MFDISDIGYLLKALANMLDGLLVLIGNGALHLF